MGSVPRAFASFLGKRQLIHDAADEERPHGLHELGGLTRPAHVLDELREGVELRSRVDPMTNSLSSRSRPWHSSPDVRGVASLAVARARSSRARP